MSCQKIGRVLRNAYKFVDEKALGIADQIIVVTGKIKTLSNSATVQEIETMLGPVATTVGGWISAGLDKIYAEEVKDKTLAEKFKVALDKTVTDYGVDGAVVKIASVATAVADARDMPQHVYDQTVDVAIARTKVPD